MQIIGITGGTGAGKTTALVILREMGAFIIDCDELYHDLLAESTEMREELKRCFPEADAGGQMDLKKLGGIVFKNRDAMSALNSITHKYVLREIKEKLIREERRGRKIAAVDAILLIESGLSKICDKTVGVISKRELRLSAQQKELSDLRLTGILANEELGKNWHKKNLDETLQALKELKK